MIVLSLFDGMACGYEALKRVGIHIDRYYSSEIDPHAIKIACKNHPDIIRLGDVTKWREWDIPKPDLIIGGSPCQGFSFAGKGLAFDDPRSKLFFDMTDIIHHYEPRFRLLENVKMKQQFLDIISDFMDCGEPHFINSALVSAQNRQRYYWYNWYAPDPLDKGIKLSDIIDNGDVDREKSYCIDANYYKGSSFDNYKLKCRRQLVRGARIVGRRIGEDGKRHDYDTTLQPEQRLEKRSDDKAGCLTTVQKDSVICDDELLHYRKLTPVECERLQTLPDGYTEGVSNTQRYRMLGNGWTVDVIAHLLSYMPITDLERMMQ